MTKRFAAHTHAHTHARIQMHTHAHITTSRHANTLQVQVSFRPTPSQIGGNTQFLMCPVPLPFLQLCEMKVNGECSPVASMTPREDIIVAEGLGGPNPEVTLFVRAFKESDNSVYLDSEHFKVQLKKGEHLVAVLCREGRRRRDHCDSNVCIRK